jgi:flagellar protein FliS
MNPEAIARTYRRSAIESAPPVKLVHLLLQGAVRFLDKAARCDPAEDAPTFRMWANRADAIVCELRASLDPGPDPVLFEQLDGLYDFCGMQIADALVQESADPLGPARRVLEMLRDAWAELELKGGS